MKLIIDAGNTTTKLAVFQGIKMVEKYVVKEKELKNNFKKIIKKFPNINKSILSSVSNLSKEDVSKELNHISILKLDHKTKVPFTNLYATPNTLGVDRIALIAGAVSQFPKKDCLVIDVGSCITYDFVNKQKEYFGGAIGLGLKMRYTSLYKNTVNLPLLAPKQVDTFVGNSTENAIHAGVTLGMQMEINAVIEDFSNKYPALVVILTGGNADFLSKRLKNGIFVVSNFLLEGLSHILDYNTNK